MEFIYPFQPPALLHDVIDQPLLDGINKMCDDLVPDGTRNYGVRVDNPLPELQEQIFKMSYDYVRAFEDTIESSIVNERHKLNISRMWFLDMQDKDYLQAHQHGNNNILSGILYCKIPEGLKKEYDTEFPTDGNRDGILISNANGCIEFTYNPMVLSANLIYSRPFLVKPKEGHMYVWPSWLYHTIYPYFGPDIRRSLSFNITNSPL